MGQQHLDALADVARLLEGVGVGDRAGHVASVFMHVARDLPRRCCRTASWLQRSGLAIPLEGEVAKRVIGADGPGERPRLHRAG